MKQTEENGGQSISLTENESYGVFKATKTSSDPATNVSMTENKSYGLFHKTGARIHLNMSCFSCSDLLYCITLF